MSMPQRIEVSEVGPRDGLQIEAGFIPTEQKLRLIDALSATGLPRIEVTAFVHPKVVPQMADAEAVLAAIGRRPGVRYGAFVPNAKGAMRAIAAGVDDLKAGMAASDSFNELNTKMTTEQGMRAIAEIGQAVRGTGRQLVGVVATAFGCPYEGPVALDRVLALFGQLVELEAPLIYLADTTGMADPTGIQTLVSQLQARWPAQRIGLHLHNTRGLGLANALAGLQVGVADFESSVGGLGGCPFAPRAVGNICSEDFVHMLHAMGLATGIDLDALTATARLAQEIVGRTLPGMVMKAGKASELHPKGVKAIKLD